MGDSAHEKLFPPRMVPCPPTWVRTLIRHLLCSSQCRLSAGTGRPANWTGSCTPSLKERNVDVPIRVRGGDREDLVGLRGGSAKARAHGQDVREAPACARARALGPRRAQVLGRAKRRAVYGTHEQHVKSPSRGGVRGREASRRSPCGQAGGPERGSRGRGLSRGPRPSPPKAAAVGGASEGEAWRKRRVA